MKEQLKKFVPWSIFLAGMTFLIASVVMTVMYFDHNAPFYDERFTPTDYYNAKIVEVYTGDMALADIDMGLDMELYSVSIKLSEIDAPDLDEPLGDKARIFLAKEVKGENVILQIDRKDKDGRWLAKVHHDGMNLNEELVKRDLARVIYE